MTTNENDLTALLADEHEGNAICGWRVDTRENADTSRVGSRWRHGEPTFAPQARQQYDAAVAAGLHAQLWRRVSGERPLDGYRLVKHSPEVK